VNIERDHAFAALPDDDCQTLAQARRSLEWPEWEQVIQLELAQLQHMGTWKLIDKPHDAIPIANKFIFAKKQDKEGHIIKYKARLVAKVLRSVPFLFSFPFSPSCDSFLDPFLVTRVLGLLTMTHSYYL